MTGEADVWTVKRLLEWTTGFFQAREVDSPRLSAELLLSHVLNCPRIKLYTDYQSIAGAAQLAQYRELVRRAARHEPIAYLTGRAPFFNLELDVCPGVLIPRPETETLVENVLQFVRHQSGFEAPRVLDLCTGSGCIAAAIASQLKNATIVASDISPDALAVARRNFQRLGLDQRITLLQGDLYEALTELVDPQPFDLILANPPYIPADVIPTLDANVRQYEPRLALDGGADGLAVIRRILAGAAQRLTSQGHVFLEIAFDQAEAAQRVAAQVNQLGQIRILKDLGGRDRVLTLRKL